MKAYIILIFLIIYCHAFADPSLNSGVRDGDKLAPKNVESMAFRFSELPPLQDLNLDDDRKVLILTDLSTPAYLTDKDNNILKGGSIVGVNDNITVTARMYRKGIAEWKYVLLEKLDDDYVIKASEPETFTVEVIKEETDPWVFVLPNPSVGFLDVDPDLTPINPGQIFQFISVNNEEGENKHKIDIEVVGLDTLDTFCYDGKCASQVNPVLELDFEELQPNEPFVFRITEILFRSKFSGSGRRNLEINYIMFDELIQESGVVNALIEYPVNFPRIEGPSGASVNEFETCSDDQPILCFKYKEEVPNNKPIQWEMEIPKEAISSTGIKFGGIDEVFGKLEICKREDNNDCEEMDPELIYTNSDYGQYVELDGAKIIITVRFKPTEDFVGNVNLLFYTIHQDKDQSSILFQIPFSHNKLHTINIPESYPITLAYVGKNYFLYPSGEAYHRVPDRLILTVDEDRSTSCGSYKLMDDDDEEVLEDSVNNPLAHYIICTPNEKCEEDKLCYKISEKDLGIEETFCHKFVVEELNDDDDDNFDEDEDEDGNVDEDEDEAGGDDNGDDEKSSALKFNLISSTCILIIATFMINVL